LSVDGAAGDSAETDEEEEYVTWLVREPVYLVVGPPDRGVPWVPGVEYLAAARERRTKHHTGD
jgi:hypothetical protein